MAACDQCNAMLSKKENKLCAKCKQEKLDSFRNEKQTMVSEVLMYSNLHRMASSQTVLSRPEEVQHAKDMLWNKFGDYNILKEHIDRRYSPNRT